MAEPRSPAEGSHGAHDLELVARAAAGDLAASEAITARDLLAACRECAELAADLRAIAAATRGLPDAAALAATRTAPRDFRLTTEDAARLRPGGLRGLADRLGRLGRAGGFAPVRGLGSAIATLGLVGLLVSAGLPGILGGLGAGGAGGAAVGAPTVGASTGDIAGSIERSSAPAPAPSSGRIPAKDQASSVPAVAPAESNQFVAMTSSSPARSIAPARDAGTPERVSADASPSTPALLSLVSIAAIVVGLALVVVGRRRRRSVP